MYCTCTRATHIYSLLFGSVCLSYGLSIGRLVILKRKRVEESRIRERNGGGFTFELVILSESHHTIGTIAEELGFFRSAAFNPSPLCFRDWSSTAATARTVSLRYRRLRIPVRLGGNTQTGTVTGTGPGVLLLLHWRSTGCRVTTEDGSFCRILGL